MSANLQEFTFGIASDIVTPVSPNYRPPTWPPQRAWPVVIDKDGQVVSRWGEGIWRLTPWYGKSAVLNFGDGQSGKFNRSERLDSANADLLRIIATWWIWGPKTANSVGSVLADFSALRQIFALCSREGISAARLMRFPRVLDAVPGALMPSKYNRVIAILHRLYDAREALGFVLVDRGGLRRLIAAAPDHTVVQTPYIPPRIWGYQLARLEECVTDFLEHRQQLEACFQLCLDAYLERYGSYETALSSEKVKKRSPFTAKAVNDRDCKCPGRFADTAARFGIAKLLSKWTLWNSEDVPVNALSSYMSLVAYAGLAYIANFTLQRKEEVATLRVSSLTWENDEKLGRVPIISGETTKTNPDSDARWVASPSVAIAFEAASAIARLRLMCSRLHPTARDTAHDDPYLFSPATEPWSNAAGQTRSLTHRQPLKGIEQALTLFDPEKMRITAEDLELAKRFTPNLPEDEFAVGKVWPLAWHQYRRTGAVNMFASGVVSDSTMQVQMKHSSRLMPLYYARNHTRLRLNEEVQGTVIRAMYEMQAERVKHAVTGSRFVSPHSQERKDKTVNLISAKDAKELASMAKKGTISFREHRLGGCMKAGVCEYGGIESVARCAGGDGGKPCSDALYDRTREPQVRADLRRITTEIEMTPKDQPRHTALLEERRAMENFLNVVATR